MTMRSASTMIAPRSARRAAIVDLPEAMPFRSERLAISPNAALMVSTAFAMFWPNAIVPVKNSAEYCPASAPMVVRSWPTDWKKALTLQAKAICRRLVGGDKTLAERLYKATTGKTDHDLKGTAFLAIAPLVAARDAIEGERLSLEKHIVKLGAQTPLAEFVKATHGVGMLSLAGVIGEAGALDEWGDMAMQIEALILAQWALAAEDVEAAMHDEGLDPEDVALLGVPAGVVPS